MKSKPIKLIKSLLICGVKYQVKYESLGGQGIDGYCNGRDKVIVIDKDVTKNHKDFYETILHEMSHAVFEESSLRQTSIDPDLEEIIVDQIAKAIYLNLLRG